MEMERLGFFLRGQRSVKTTTHDHPILNHNSTSVQQTDLKKKPTTSPASTLSDKGIGSSVGSFDSEFRHDYSITYPLKISYDPNKTGSLDSRTQEVNEKTIPAHSRSSSDIICQSVASDTITQATLADQSAILWNQDPRRHSTMGSDVPSVRPRRSSTRRHKPRNDSSVEREAEVKKLPQLCRDSPAHSTVSCSQSTTSTVSTLELGSTNGLPSANVGSYEASITSISESADSISSKSTPISNHPPSPFSNDIAPPLPPKASHLRNQAKFPVAPHTMTTTSQMGWEQNSNPCQVPLHPRQGSIEYADTANSTLAGRPRLPLDIVARTTAHSPYKQLYPMWSNDARREAPVPLNPNHHTPLSSGLNSGMGKADSVGRILHGNEKLSVAKFHGSTSALLNFDRPHNPISHPEKEQLGGLGDEKFNRHSVTRSSARSNPGDRKRGSIDTQERGPTLRPTDVTLQALRFDLPQAISSESKFVGRDWLFSDILSIFSHKDSKINKAAIIIGDNGRGKSSVIDHIVSLSYQGGRNVKHQGRPEHEAISRVNSSLCRSSSPLNRQFHQMPQHYSGNSNHSSRTGSPAPSFGSGASNKGGSQISLNEETCRKVASQVVAFHFCQADSNTTCFVPEFVHSIAAQLSHAPQLTAYREVILSNASLRNLLSIKNCILNPSQALKKSIIEPLAILRREQKIPKSNLIILIDAINESELHRPDYGYSILSFLKEHLPHFPDFIKVVVTCRTGDKSLVQEFPGQFISLDCDNPKVSRDMQLYISHRISKSTVLSNLTLSGKSDTTVAQKQLTQHLLKVADGNFLYLRMTLDLMDKEVIMPKSAGFTTVPTDLYQLFLLQCNLRFRSYTSFNEYRDVISVALASLYPLKDEQLYQAVCSSLPPNALPWQYFKQQMDVLDELLVQNPCTGGRAFFHPLFREWLMGLVVPSQGNGTLQSSNRFKVDVKRGYFLLASVLSKQPPERLYKHATLELAHHVLKAGMFKTQSKETGVSASEYNAQFMAGCTIHSTEALICERNLFFPNMKISKLLLRAGANPNVKTSVFCNAPPLAIAAHNGWIELAQLLLMFEADVNFPASNGMSALTFAAAAGRLDVVKLLLQYRPMLSQVDQNGHTPLLHAISRNHSSVAKLLLSRGFYLTPDHHKMAAQQGLVAAATTGDIEFMQYLLDNREFQCDVNVLEPSHGESPLTSAATRGKASVCEFLIGQYQANLYLRNQAGLTPLLCAVKSGEWDTADMLLNCGATLEACDPTGKTPLIMAAYQGHLGLLEQLMSRDADVQACDKEGLTALEWSALRGHDHCVRSLIGRSDIHHCDINGRTALDLAAFYGNPQVVDLLLDAGADIRHRDATGMCALDRAIGCQNRAVVTHLLARGAVMQSSAWKMATGKPEILSALLSHTLDEGNTFYKQVEFKHAHEIFARGLKQAGELPLDGRILPSLPPAYSDICAHLHLGYSRCSRKLDSLEEAELSATRALELNPNWYEALYARSRVLREKSRLKEALRDVMDAERFAPSNNIKEIRRLIERIKEEIRKSGARYSRPSSVTSEVNIPQARPRLNSASSFHGNPSSCRSPSPPIAELSRSHQTRSSMTRVGSQLSADTQRLVRGNSQESLAESMAGLGVNPNNALGHRNNSVRRAPRTNPHWRPQTNELSRSLSVDGRGHMVRYHDNLTTSYSENLGFNGRNPYTGGPGDGSRPPLVTDL